MNNIYIINVNATCQKRRLQPKEPQNEEMGNEPNTIHWDSNFKARALPDGEVEWLSKPKKKAESVTTWAF